MKFNCKKQTIHFINVLCMWWKSKSIWLGDSKKLKFNFITFSHVYVKFVVCLSSLLSWKALEWNQCICIIIKLFLCWKIVSIIIFLCSWLISTQQCVCHFVMKLCASLCIDELMICSPFLLKVVDVDQKSYLRTNIRQLDAFTKTTHKDKLWWKLLCLWLCCFCDSQWYHWKFHQWSVQSSYCWHYLCDTPDIADIPFKQ